MDQKILSIGKVQVPALGLGTYGLMGKDGERAIEHALSIGYRHIDTAGFYGNEDVVGNAIRNSGIPRHEIFITTKVWPSGFSRKRFIPAVQASLKKLKVDSIDLLLLHWPADAETNKLATGLLNECLDLQYTMLAGVSNFSLSQLKEAQKQMPVFCNQVEYSPYKNNSGLLQYMQQQNMLLTAYSPLARGKVLREPVIQNLAKKHQKMPSQIVLRWLMQQDNVAAIPKAGSQKHSLENLDIFGFELSDEGMRDVFGLGTK